MPNNKRNEDLRDADEQRADGDNTDKRTPSDDRERGGTAGGGKQSSASEKDSDSGVSGQG